MQVTVETTEGLKRRMTITVPAETVEVAVNAELKNIAKNRRFDGFRPGKAPLSLVSRMYGPAVRGDVLGDVMQRQFIEAIIEHKISPAGAPTFTPVNYEEKKDLTFDATFEIYPDIELKDLEKIEVVKPLVSVKDEDVEGMLVTLQKQQATWTESEVADENSRVEIDFVGTINDEPFEGGTAKKFVLAMGQNRMIPGFEDGIIGKKAGDSFVADITFPEDYHAEKLKGQAAKFTIDVLKVEASELPELTEEFVQRFGIADGSVDALKAEIRKNMERELKQSIKNRVKEQVIDGLLQTNEFEIPVALIDQEVEILRKQALQRFGNTNQNVELPRELFEEQAIKRIKVGLLLGEMISSNELTVDEERVNTVVAELASAYEDPQSVIDYYSQEKQMLENIRNSVLEDQAIDAIVSKAKLSEAEMSFNDLMNPTQA